MTGWAVKLAVSSGAAAMIALAPNAGASSDALPLPLATVGLRLLAALLVLAHGWRALVPLQDTGAIVRHAVAGDSFMTVRVDGSVLVHYLRDTINHLLE